MKTHRKHHRRDPLPPQAQAGALRRRARQAPRHVNLPAVLAFSGAAVALLCWLAPKPLLRLLEALNAIPASEENALGALYHAHRIVGALPWFVLAGLALGAIFLYRAPRR